MATIKGEICGPRYSIGIPQSTSSYPKRKMLQKGKREKEKKLERERKGDRKRQIERKSTSKKNHLTAVHNAAINGQKWKSCGFACVFRLKTIEQNLCAICTQTNGRQTKIHTHIHTQIHTRRGHSHAKTQENFLFARKYFCFSLFIQWMKAAHKMAKLRLSRLSLTSLSQLPVRSLARTADTHSRTHVYVCCIYWIKKQNLVKDKARSAAENSWAAVWSSCCRCCCFYCYCCCCCCYRSLYVHKLLLLLLQS